MSIISDPVFIILLFFILLFLILRMVTKDKSLFVISVGFIVSLSVYTWFTLGFSVLWYFLGAIIFSFVGDLLMAEYIKITDQKTLDGIMGFSIAHILYMLGFYNLNPAAFTWRLWWMIPLYLLLTIGLYYYIGYNPEYHPAILIANFVYTSIIVLLLIFVLGFITSQGITAIIVFVALGGVILFLISDGVLAYNEFQGSIPHAKDIIAFTYILAQLLLQLTPILTLVTY